MRCVRACTPNQSIRTTGRFTKTCDYSLACQGMSVVTTQSLGIVGAEIAGVQPDHLMDDPGFPAACMSSLEEHGVLVFRGLDIDDETQIEFSRRLDQVGKSVPAEPPRIFLVTLDPAKNPVAEYLRGTFFWHIDGAQDDTPTKATMLRRACRRGDGRRD